MRRTRICVLAAAKRPQRYYGEQFRRGTSRLRRSSLTCISAATASPKVVRKAGCCSALRPKKEVLMHSVVCPACYAQVVFKDRNGDFVSLVSVRTGLVQCLSFRRQTDRQTSTRVNRRSTSRSPGTFLPLSRAASVGTLSSALFFRSDLRQRTNRLDSGLDSMSDPTSAAMSHRPEAGKRFRVLSVEGEVFGASSPLSS